MMILNLLKTTDDIRVCAKTVIPVATITATPTEKINILNPSFIVEYKANLLTANYCYIAELNRYYYITSHTLEKGNRLIFNCEVDVLKTYYEQIKNCNATVIRSESIGKPTPIPDKQLPIDPNRQEILSIILDKDPLTSTISEENQYHYILTAIAGKNIN